MASSVIDEVEADVETWVEAEDAAAEFEAEDATAEVKAEAKVDDVDRAVV